MLTNFVRRHRLILTNYALFNTYHIGIKYELSSANSNDSLYYYHWGNIMFDQIMKDLDDLSYEDMDDLPLLDHIEWSHFTDEDEPIQDPSQLYWQDD